MQYFDVGVNLSSEQFAKDRDAVVTRARSVGMKNMLLIGSNIADSQHAISLAKKYSVVATAGIHPHDAKLAQDDFCQQVQALAKHSQVVAIGECGLDYNRDFSPRSQQRDIFSAQVELANKLKKPLYMHQRDAHEDFLNIVKGAQTAGLVHCFTDNKNALKSYLDLDFYIGVTGWLCDERRGQELRELRELLNYIPLDRVMFETDAPYLIPRDLKPKAKSRRNEPCYLPHIIEQAAILYKLPIAKVAKAAFNNAQDFFQLRQS